MDTLSGIFAHIPSWFSMLTSVVTAASAVAALTPTPKDDAIVGKVYRIIDFLALNIGHAKETPPNSSSRS